MAGMKSIILWVWTQTIHRVEDRPPAGELKKIAALKRQQQSWNQSSPRSGAWPRPLGWIRSGSVLGRSRQRSGDRCWTGTGRSFPWPQEGIRTSLLVHGAVIKMISWLSSSIDLIFIFFITSFAICLWTSDIFGWVIFYYLVLSLDFDLE